MGDYPNTILLTQILELYTLSQIWFYFEDRGYDLYYWHISIDLYSNYILTVQFHCEYRGRVSGSVFIIFLLHWYCFNNCPVLSAVLTKGQSQCFWQRKELNEKSSRISQIIKSSKVFSSVNLVWQLGLQNISVILSTCEKCTKFTGCTARLKYK